LHGLRRLRLRRAGRRSELPHRVHAQWAPSTVSSCQAAGL
jgi:hypothetical protein